MKKGNPGIHSVSVNCLFMLFIHSDSHVSCTNSNRDSCQSGLVESLYLNLLLDFISQHYQTLPLPKMEALDSVECEFCMNKKHFIGH